MMHRRSFIKSSSLLLGAATLPAHRIFGMIFDETAHKMSELRGGVGYFTERGGTIGYYLSGDGIAVIDSQFPPQATHLIDEVQKKYDAPFDLLVNTHHHGDHTAGNIAFKGLVKEVVAHDNSLKNQKNVATRRGTGSEQLYPGTTFSDSWSRKLGGETISLSYHGRAHTDGDAIIHFEEANVVHMGDLMFNRRHPYIDRGAGASIENWIEVLDQAYDRFDRETLFIYGHAGEGHEVTGTRQDLRAKANYLTRLLELVADQIKKGKDIEAFAAAYEQLPGAEEWRGRGLERNIRTAYAELTEEGG